MCTQISLRSGDRFEYLCNAVTDILFNNEFYVDEGEKNSDTGIEKIVIILLERAKIFGQESAGNMNDILGDWPGLNDFEGGTLFIGTKGKAACGWGGRNPILLPLGRNKEISIPKKYPRIDGDMDGHWWQWVDACIAGYGNAEVDSPFVGYAGPLTETVLMGNLLLRSFNIREKVVKKDPVYGDMESFIFPGRYINYKWDGENMRITNFEQANQFVKREYRKGWGELKF